MCEVHVVSGSYAHVLFGYDFVVPSEGNATVVPRSVLALCHHLVSGSADETIKVYDLARQKEVGTLFEQQGTLTCLEFFQGAGGGVGARHMLSGSEDGSIVVWDAKAWDSMKVLRGHKGAVVDLSIHPTGRLALSVGRDKTLYTWNLLKGRSAYVTALKKIPSLVQWFNKGDSYAVVMDTTINLHATATGAVYKTLTAPSKIHAISFTTDSKRLIVGCNDELVRFFDIESAECVHTINAHDNRVRNLSVVPSSDGSGRDCLVTSSTDGCIRVWWVGEDGEEQPREAMVGEVKTRDRLTCMAVLHAGTVTPSAAAVPAKPAPKKSIAQKRSEKKRRQKARKQAAAKEAAKAEDDDDEAAAAAAEPAANPKPKAKPKAEPTAEEAEARKEWKAARQKRKNQARKERLAAAKRTGGGGGGRGGRPSKKHKSGAKADTGFETVPLEGGNRLAAAASIEGKPKPNAKSKKSKR
eukprot:gene5526-22282_t